MEIVDELGENSDQHETIVVQSNMNPNIATCQEIDMSVGNSTGNVTKISEKYFLHHKLLSYYVDFYS